MNTIDQVLTQWEPKVFSMMRGMFISPEDREDLAQELRLTIIRSWKKFDPTKGAIFHTYLHVAMTNTIRGYLWKQKRRPIESELLDNMGPSQELVSESFVDALKQAQLGPGEMLLLDLYLCGYNTSEIQRFCEHPNKVGKVKQSLRKKFDFLHEKIGGMY